MSQIPPDLTHMPPHIRQMIVNESGTRTKLSQRELSRDFKFEVEKAPIRYFRLKLKIFPQLVKLFWTKTGGDPIVLTFEPSANGYIMKNEKEQYEKESEGDYRKAAVERLLRVFKHSKVSVGELIIKITRSMQYIHPDATIVFEEFNRILSEKRFQLRVEKLTFSSKVNQQQVLSVLRYLKPITLKSFRLGARLNYQGQDSARLGFDEVVLTEQWMGLEQVDMRYVEFDILLERWSHLTDVTILFPRHPTCSLLRIFETFLLKPTLKRVYLHWWWNLDDGRYDTTSTREFVNRFEKIPELSSDLECCVKLPYEGNNRMFIVMQGNLFVVGRAPQYTHVSPLRRSPSPCRFGCRHPLHRSHRFHL